MLQSSASSQTILLQSSFLSRQPFSLASSLITKTQDQWMMKKTWPPILSARDREGPVPQGRQRTTHGFPHQAILGEWLKWPQRQIHPRKRVFLLWFCFLFNNMPFPSPHHISIRLLCKTSSLPELVWRPRGANEHLGHSCTPNQVFATFHWPEVDQQASLLIHHLPLLHR